MDVISRDEAKAVGKKRYFTGRPCPSGHLAERLVRGYYCTTCSRLNGKQWSDKNLEKVRQRSRDYRKRSYVPHPRKRRDQEAGKLAARESGKRWREKNKEFDRVRAETWRRENPELARAVTRAWRQKNKDKLLAKESRRRTRKKGGGGSFLPSDIVEIFFSQKGKCACCRSKLDETKHIDHIVPVSKGGTSNRQNLQLLCRTCNFSKGAKDPIDFMRTRGRLL